MAIDHLGKDLEALDVSGRDLRCLLYLPQIYVGWASPQRDVSLLEALLDTTARRAQFHHECLGIARGWLFERPTRAQFQSGFALLRVLRRATHERPLISSSDVLEAMLWAVRLWAAHAAKVARLTDPTGAVSELQRTEGWRALNDLERWLEVDTSHLWLDILSDECERLAQPSPAPQWPALSEVRDAPSGPEPKRPAAFPDSEADDEHSALLLIREPARLRAAPFPLARRIG
jgi:hypothetical protein